VPFGSLYQYFPDKTAIIGTLAERYKLIMTLIAATVRHAITQDAKEAARILTLFKRMLPKNLAVLEM
jgi:AcrR family transcriptional regulator